MSDDDSPRTEHQIRVDSQDRLRAELLTSGLSDWVPLAEVITAITHYHLAETLTEEQELALSTIRSLLHDGLMKIGGLPGPGQIPDWGLSIDAAMDRVYDLYVTHYDEPIKWEFIVWLGLTENGERVARTLEAEAAD
jgi:hypothetical protein